MKRTTQLLTVIILLFSLNANARFCTAITSGGDWSNPTTWDCGTAPTDNDTMWVPMDITVVVDINSPEYDNMLVIVDGTLDFENGQKINICPGGVYVTQKGSLTGGNPGSKIDICGTTAWTGPGPTFGPVSYGSSAVPSDTISYWDTGQTPGGVLVRWETDPRNESTSYSIERSLNGMTWVEIGRVASRGNSSQTANEYSFTDPSPAAGTNYYRIKQSRGNGYYHYSDTKVVDISSNEGGCEFKVYPNPCQGQCTVNFSDCPSDNDGTITVQVIDANGQLVSEDVPQRNAEGGFTTSIDASNNMAPGVYIVRGVSSKKSYTQNAVIK